VETTTESAVTAESTAATESTVAASTVSTMATPTPSAVPTPTAEGERRCGNQNTEADGNHCHTEKFGRLFHRALLSVVNPSGCPPRNHVILFAQPMPIVPGLM
jgi:hypothetical protein